MKSTTLLFRVFLGICTMLVHHAVSSQNLIPDPGFENWNGAMGSTPNTLGPLFDWTEANGSPDHHHVLNPVGVTLSGIDPTCMPATTGANNCGSAYAGQGVLGTYKANSQGGTREWASTQLSTPLVAGQQYIISFWIKNQKDRPGYEMATNHWGVFFDNAMIPATDPDTWNHSALSNQWVATDDVIAQGVWQHVELCYTADNAYTHAYVGFMGDWGSATMNTWSSSGSVGFYVWIDEVSVVPTSSATATASITDESCPGTMDGAIDLQPSPGLGTPSYLWSNGAVTEDISGLTPGTYDVTITYTSGCIITDSYTIGTGSGGPQPGQDSSLTVCDNDVAADLFPLLGSSADPSGTWSGPSPLGGGNLGTFDPATMSPGIYTYTTGGGFCPMLSATVNVTVNASPSPTISGALSYCPGSNTTLDAGGPYTSYSWSNGGSTQTDLFTIADNPVTVSVTAANGCSATSSPVTLSEFTQPLPVINGSLDYCVGDVATLDVTTAVAATYQWSNGATSSSSTFTIADNPITATATSADGCVGTSAPVNVTENTLPTPVITGDTMSCPGVGISLTTGNYATYVWSTGAGTQNVTASDLDSPVTVTVTDTNGCTGTSNPHEILPFSTPTAGFTMPTMLEICQGSDTGVYLILSGTANWTVEYELDGTPQSPLNGIAQDTLWLPNLTGGTYTLTSVVDGNGCQGTLSPNQLTIQELAIPAAPVISGPVSYCVGDPTDLTACGLGTDFHWYADATLGQVLDSGITYQGNYPVGTHDIWVQETNGHCIGAVSQVTIEVVTGGAIELPESFDICLGDSVLVNAQATSSPIVWSTGDTSTNQLWYGPAITSMLIGSISSACGVLSDTTWGYVHNMPTVDAGPDITILLGESANINATSNGTYFSWTHPQMLDCSDCLTPVAVPGSTTSFVITASDEYGCTSQDTMTVIIDGVWEIHVPNVFSPNGDGWNDLFEVQGPPMDGYRLTVFNRWGEKLFDSQERSTAWDGTFRGQVVNSGVFVYQLKGRTQDGRIVEQSGNVTVIR